MRLGELLHYVLTGRPARGRTGRERPAAGVPAVAAAGDPRDLPRRRSTRYAASRPGGGCARDRVRPPAAGDRAGDVLDEWCVEALAMSSVRRLRRACIAAVHTRSARTRRGAQGAQAGVPEPSRGALLPRSGGGDHAREPRRRGRGCGRGSSYLTGPPYHAMELLDGMSVRDHLAAGRVAPAVVLTWSLGSPRCLPTRTEHGDRPRRPRSRQPVRPQAGDGAPRRGARVR